MMRTIARAAAVALLMACGATAMGPAVASAARAGSVSVHREGVHRGARPGARPGWLGCIGRDSFRPSTATRPSSRCSGRTILTSSEFNALGYDNTSKMIVAFRTILNRDGDPTYAAGQLDPERSPGRT